MVKLSANQAIMLLQIYRGTLKDELRIGTYTRDINCLKESGYIEQEGDGYTTTRKGDCRVSKMLGFGFQNLIIGEIS